jgi:hypothetical protein
MSPGHNIPAYFLIIHFNIILLSTASILQVVSSIQVLQLKLCMHTFTPLKCSTCAAHLILIDLITQIIFGEDYTL